MNHRIVRRGRVTASDVAKQAGVSRSAVSRCFGGSKSISPATREKVLQASRALGYRPNAIARSLTGRQTDLVALIVAEQDNPHTKVVEDILIERLSEFGKRTLLVPVTETVSVDESTLYALDYQVDAIIVIGGSVSRRIVDELRQLNLPLFLFGDASEEPGIESFTCDNARGGELAARFLLRAKHKRIAYLTKTSDTSSNSQRREGLKRVLASAGQSLHAEARESNSHEGGVKGALRLLSMEEPPDAIFCFNDALAIGALEAALILKLRVPEDVAILGFDNIPMSSWRAIDLSTIRNEVPALIDALVARMVRRWAGEEATARPVVVEPTIVVRGTTR